MKKQLISILLLLSSNVWAGAIGTENAYVRLLPPTQKNTGAFMTFHNSSNKNIAAIGAKSDVADKIELHNHTHDNGVMRMRQVDKIEIPAGGQTELKPGGFHMMLLGLKTPLALNQTVEIEINFDDGSSERIKAEVKSVAAGMKMSGSMKMKKKMNHD